jgi:predicted transcriptional regulator of viral defense system
LKVDEWLDLFRGNRGKRLFSLSDLVLLTGDRRSSLTVQLSRLVSSGVIERPARGWYANPFALPSDEEVAMIIRRPSYLSMEYALSRHGVLSQQARVLTVVTTRLPYTFRSGDTVFEYHQVKRSLFRGYRSEGEVLVAEPEKALLDLVYVRHVRGRDMARKALDSLVDDMYLEELDAMRLHQHAKLFDSKTRSVIEQLLGTGMALDDDEPDG